MSSGKALAGVAVPLIIIALYVVLAGLVQRSHPEGESPGSGIRDPRTHVYRPSGVRFRETTAADRAEPPIVQPESFSEPEREAGVIEGRCVDEIGQAVGGAIVFATRERFETVRLGTSEDAGRVSVADAEGRFRCRLPLGLPPINVIARHSAFRPAVQVLADPVGAGDLRLVLSVGKTIAGRVVGVDGSSLGAVTVLARGCRADGVAMDPNVASGPGVRLQSARSAPDGTFELRGLEDRAYILQVYSAGLRRVEETLPPGALVQNPGDAGTIVVEPAAVITAMLVDDETDRPIAGAVLKVDRAKARDAGFYPGVSFSGKGGIRPFVLGPPGFELTALGANPDELPSQDGSNGRAVIHGVVDSFPVPEGRVIEVDAEAPGYATATVSLPLHAWDLPRLPAATVVRLKQAGAIPAMGSLKLQVRTCQGEWLRSARVLLGLWRHPEGPSTEGQPARGRNAQPPGMPAEGEELEAWRRVVSWQASNEVREATEGLEPIFRWVQLAADGTGIAEHLPPGDYSFREHDGLVGPSFSIAGGLATECTADMTGPLSGILVREELQRLSVQCTDVDGKPLPGCGLVVARTGDGPEPPHILLKNSRPWLGSEIIPAGSSLGERPIDLDLPLGSYEVKAQRPGYVSDKQVVELKARPVVLTLHLREVE